MWTGDRLRCSIRKFPDRVFRSLLTIIGTVVRSDPVVTPRTGRSTLQGGLRQVFGEAEGPEDLEDSFEPADDELPDASIDEMDLTGEPEAEFCRWDEEGFFCLPNYKDKTFRELLTYAGKEIKAAMYRELDTEKGSGLIQNLSRSMIQKIISQHIPYYLKWLALHGDGDHRRQVRYKRACVVQDPCDRVQIP